MPAVWLQPELPRSQAVPEVTIPLVVVTHWEVTLAPAVPLILKLLLPPITRLMSPVDVLPKVRVCLLVVANSPAAVKYAAPDVPAETEAVGVPLLILRIANLAEVVPVPPMRRSMVLLPG